MQKKPSKKKRTQNSKSKQRTKKPRPYNDANCSLLQDVGSISDLFKNQVLKKKGASMQNTSQINFNSTINNYTSVYTVISSSLKPQKTKSTKNIIAGGVKGTVVIGQKKKAPTKQKSKSKLGGQGNKQPQRRKKSPSAKVEKQRTRHVQKQRLQPYELIPQSKNSLNSQIVFSTQQTKRESQQSQKNKQQSSRIYDSLTRISEENMLINNNKMLRSTIRQEYRRKNEAATKIQKVFRGYLTRKILQKYIKQEQEKLLGLLNEYQSSSHRKNHDQHRNEDRMKQKINAQCQFFSNKISQGSRNYSPKTFQDEESINLSKLNPSQYRFNQQESSKLSSSQRTHSNRFFTNINDIKNSNKQNKIINCERDIDSSSSQSGQGYDEYERSEEYNQQGQDFENNQAEFIDGENQEFSQQQAQNQDEQQELEEQSSQSEEGVIAYRHHDVIYDRSQIQQYLQSSSESQQEHQYQKQSKQQDLRGTFRGIENKKVEHIMNKNQIIFQTNEEHIQSRKNSLLNKNNASVQVNGNNLMKKQPQQKGYVKYNGQKIEQKCIMLMKQMENEQSYAIQSDLDLIKTSKVNSIHNHSKSHKTSYREIQCEQLSPRRKTQSQNKQDHSQKTSKKQCKKLAYPKNDINISSNDDSEVYHKKNLQLQVGNQNLQTIKILSNSNEKYSPKIKNNQKKAFMDTISYNSEFKTKHQIDNVSSEKISEKKNSLKKKIYYFSDSSEHPEDNQKQQQSKEISISSKKSRKNSPRSINQNELQRLKNSQMQRWDQVIKLINLQIGEQKGKSKQFQGFIKQVMELSIKNKQMLQQMMSQQNSRVKNQNTFKTSRIDEIFDQKDNDQEEQKQKKWRQFKDTLSSGRRKSITEQDIAVFKPHSRIILSSKGNNQKLQPSEQKSKPTFFKQSKDELKQKINKIEQQNMKHVQESRVNQFSLLNNIQNDQIEQMLKVRQQMLQKRQCEELTKLNEKLIKKEITQKEFLQNLSKLTQNFRSEKQSIDKAKQDITKGYNAAVKLIKEAFFDAKKIGYKMPLSKSSDSYKLSKHLGFNVLTGLNNVIIDELNSKEQIFAMKHFKPHEEKQKPEPKSARQAATTKQSQPLRLKQITIQLTESKYEKQEKQAQHLSQQRSPSQKPTNLQSDFIPDSNKTFSQQSESIINNLSSSGNSFVKQFYEAQMQPKHQPIQQTSVSDMKKNIFYSNMNDENNFDDFGSEESEEVQFSEQELRRFRKAQPYDPSIADLNKNLMIGKEFFEMQKTSFEQNDSNQNYQTDRVDEDDKISNESDTQLLRMRLYRQVYEIEENDQMGISTFQQNNKANDPKVEFIVEKELQFLLFEISVELMMKPSFSEKFLYHKRQQMFGIKRVSDDCRKQFIEIVQEIRPKSQQLFHRVNQNISPLPKQLLKCMRIDFSEQDEENQNEEQQYQEIGKYEMILDQQLCSTAIEKYHQFLNEQKENKFQLQLLTGDSIETLRQQFKGLMSQQWQEKSFTYLQQREKFVTNRKQHCESIRWQFINMELHCLFDSWNEQIIQLKNNRNGFSGIGLNELTLSMIDRNRKIKPTQIQEMMTDSKFKLMKILNYEEEIIEQINKQIYEQNGSDFIKTQGTESKITQNLQKSLTQKLKETKEKYAWVYLPNKEIDEEIDTEQEAKWIYYSDEALSYGLQLVYLVEEELFGEIAKQFKKLLLKGQIV